MCLVYSFNFCGFVLLADTASHHYLFSVSKLISAAPLFFFQMDIRFFLENTSPSILVVIALIKLTITYLKNVYYHKEKLVGV